MKIDITEKEKYKACDVFFTKAPIKLLIRYRHRLGYESSFSFTVWYCDSEHPPSPPAIFTPKHFNHRLNKNTIKK